ncbi:MAG: hydroxyisourate hydrolase [Phototrophicaceae bacterium]
MGKLTTHVLDIYHGQPAAYMGITLWRINNDERTKLVSVQTNDDGRCAAPLLQNDAMQIGEYELVFNVRDYFIGKEVASPFLNHVPIRFTIFDVTSHYHVPLLVSPWAYNTYRGS